MCVYEYIISPFIAFVWSSCHVDTQRNRSIIFSRFECLWAFKQLTIENCLLIDKRELLRYGEEKDTNSLVQINQTPRVERQSGTEVQKREVQRQSRSEVDKH